MLGEPAHGSIYQVRASTWLRRAGAPEAPADTATIGAKLLPYVRHMGFTHIELLLPAEAALPQLAERCAALGLGLLPPGAASPQLAGEHGLSFDDPWQTGVAEAAQHLLPPDSVDRAQRFATLRACAGLLWGQPGCRRVVMGSEFAQQRAWPADGGLDWHLLADPLHEGVQRLMHDLNHLRRDCPALHETASDFAWVERGNTDGAVLAFVRADEASGQTLLVAGSFAPAAQPHYRLGVPQPGRYTERLVTDSRHYGGNTPGWPNGSAVTEPLPWGGFAQSLVLALPALCTLMLEHQR